MKLSPHFELWEFEVSQTAARKGIDNKIPPELIPNVTELAQLLEHVRILFNRPLIISSGYRSLKLNKAVGGASKSQHLTASAADFRIPGLTVKEVCEAINKSGIQFDQLINEFGQWIHISVSKKPRRMYFDIV